MDATGKIYTVMESSEKTVPKSLESVIRSIQNSFKDPTSNQLLMGVMYTLMLECGYTLIFSNEQKYQNISPGKDSVIDLNKPAPDITSDQLQTLKQTFNYKKVLLQANVLLLESVEANEVSKLTFRLIGLDDYSFNLLIIFRKRLAVVDMIVNRNDQITECYSFAFLPSLFVKESNDDKNIASKFYNLRNFSILFKDNIAFRGRSHVLNSLQIANNSLEGLPEEIFLKIMQLLGIDEIENVAVTCTRFFSGVFRQCSLWIFLLKRDFSLTINNYESVEQLISKYREEKDKIRRNSNPRNRLIDTDGMFEDADEPIVQLITIR
ncbi:uncharacterized protein LOC111064125 isoform X2 [Nilaparvata lugens]|uniref:uncharacterized protein LOC111064125 isoform X2 n=1 Tax=Nilaparvata lugens TaxID=108931 RepID=UPI00193EA6B4|nr:uncharacterized protein LOC111064125 isoform X2 [Nilaparvata lugens]